MVHIVLGASHHLSGGNPLLAARAFRPVPPEAPTAQRTAHYCNSPSHTPWLAETSRTSRDFEPTAHCLSFVTSHQADVWIPQWTNVQIWANNLARGWRHNSRKFIAIPLVIQNEFDLKTWITGIKQDLRTQTEHSRNSHCKLDCTSSTVIQNWNLRQTFSALHGEHFCLHLYKPLVTFAHDPGSLPITIQSVIPSDYKLAFFKLRDINTDYINRVWLVISENSFQLYRLTQCTKMYLDRTKCIGVPKVLTQ